MSLQNNIKKILNISLSLIFIIACASLNVKAEVIENEGICIDAKSVIIDENIPGDATAYVENKYLEVIQAAKPYNDTLCDGMNEYSIGTPFVIYSSTNDIWNSVYYYPIIYQNDIVLIISVIDTNYGLTLSASTEMVSELNSIDYISDSSWLFYENDNNIYAVSKDSRVVIAESVYNVQNLTFNLVYDAPQEYDELLYVISENLNDNTPFNVDEVIANTANKEIHELYAPSFNTNTSTSKICSLYNPKGQIGGTCWAGSVATIVNYRLGTNYDAYDVCDKIGHSYAGGTIGDKQAALQAYGVNYNRSSSSQAPWSSLVNNISNKYPLAASTFNSNNEGHAMTVYGYQTIGTTDYVVFWNTGTQASTTVLYRSSGTTYTYNSQVWTWTKTLHCLA